MSDGCPSPPYKVFGVILCLLSAAAFGLGVSDVVIGLVGYHQPLHCSSSASEFCTSLALKLTWVGVGIWASIPPFVAGIAAIVFRHHKQHRHRLLFFALCFLSLVLFSPAMSVVSAVEVWKGTGVFYNIPVNEAGLLKSGRSSSDTVKLSVSLTVGVIGAVLLLILLTAFTWQCCCCGPCVERPSQGSPIGSAELNRRLGSDTGQDSSTLSYEYNNQISAVNAMVISRRPRSGLECNGQTGNCQHRAVDHQRTSSSCYSPPSFISSSTCHDNKTPEAVVYSTSANEAPPGVAYTNWHFGRSPHHYRWSWRK